jgi:hypothetical protein
MSKKQNIYECDILRVFADEMDENGVNRKLVRLDIDESMVSKIAIKSNSVISFEDLKKLADKCIANEWLEPTVMGAGKYGQLMLTATGLGVIRSRQRKDEMMKKRSLLKKTSDYIEDHKGLFVALGVAVALAGLLVRLFGGTR